MLSLLSLGLFAIAAPLPGPKFPDGPPPQVAVVQVDESGRPFLDGTVIMEGVRNVVYYTTVERVGQGGQIESEVVPVTTQQKYLYLKPVYLDTKEVQVFSLYGKRLEPAEVRRLLSRPTKVLVSVDGKPLARIHLDGQREATFYVISPALTGATAPRLPLIPAQGAGPEVSEYEIGSVPPVVVAP